MSFEKIEGESGLFEIKKVKILYEITVLSNGYIKKNLDTSEIRLIKLEDKKDDLIYKKWKM